MDKNLTNNKIFKIILQNFEREVMQIYCCALPADFFDKPRDNEKLLTHLEIPYSEGDTDGRKCDLQPECSVHDFLLKI